MNRLLDDMDFGEGFEGCRDHMIIEMKKVIAYIKESYDELVHKVSWPTYSELANSAVVVLYASLLIAVVVFAMDFCFQHLMEFVYPH